MPRISVFFGITISMYWDDHPPPHFHAICGGRESKVAIESLDVIAGSLPVAAHRRVQSWAALHRLELLANWTRGMAHEPFEQIEPQS